LPDGHRVVARYAILAVDGPDRTMAGAWKVGVLAEIVALFASVQ
jgi:hypothetical protein